MVFEWPVTVPWRLHIMQDVIYMYRSTAHWQPLLNGYSGHYPRDYVELLLHMRSFPYTDALDYLRRRGATVLILHEQFGTRPTYQQALERLHRDPVREAHRAESRQRIARDLLPTPADARVAYALATSISAAIRWCDPGSSATAASPTLAVSTHSIPGHSSSPKSGIARALAIHGFQITVERDPDLPTVMRLFHPASWTTHAPSVSR